MDSKGVSWVDQGWVKEASKIVAGEVEVEGALLHKHLYLKHPFYGSRQMSEHLKRDGYFASRHKVKRLMKLMGICAVYQKPNTSKKNSEHKITNVSNDVKTLRSAISNWIMLYDTRRPYFISNPAILNIEFINPSVCLNGCFNTSFNE